MHVTTSGSLRRIDLATIVSLIPPLREEWAPLRFDASGALVNPMTGETESTLHLVEGSHRREGATYVVVTESPRMEVQGATSVQVGVNTHRTFLTTRADDSRHLALTIRDESRTWSVDLDLTHGRLPRVDLVGTADVTAILTRAGVPRLVARMFGGKGAGTAAGDLNPIEGRGGQLLVAEGKVKRFRGSADANVTTTARTWDVDGGVQLRTRGLGRVITMLFGGHIRRSTEKSLATFWADADRVVDEWQHDLTEMSGLVGEVGGPEAFVHRALWDRSFDIGAAGGPDQA